MDHRLKLKEVSRNHAARRASLGIMVAMWLTVPITAWWPGTSAAQSGDVPTGGVVAAGVAGPDDATTAAAEAADGRDESGRVVGPSFALADVPATSVLLDDAAGRLRDALATRAAAVVRRDTARTDALSAAVVRSSAAATADRLDQRAAKLRQQLERTRSDTVQLAIAKYVTGTTHYDELDATASIDARLDRMADTRIGDSASADLSDSIRTLDRVLADTIDEAASMRSAAATAAAAATERSRDALVATRAVTQLDATVRQARRDVADARPTSIVAGSDLPMVALDAYWRASRRLAELQPRCGLSWSLLAGIGRSESGHGNFGGATARPDGSETAPIIGIALDGTNNTRAIPDSDHGELDGDPLVDRAVGPMQFLPGTWRRWGADLSGDGIIDPQNIYDSALTAGRYLCSAGGDLSTGDGQRRAVLAYNRSDAYADLVLSRAESYRALPVPVPVPVPGPAT